MTAVRVEHNLQYGNRVCVQTSAAIITAVLLALPLLASTAVVERYAKFPYFPASAIFSNALTVQAYFVFAMFTKTLPSSYLSSVGTQAVEVLRRSGVVVNRSKTRRLFVRVIIRWRREQRPSRAIFSCTGPDPLKAAEKLRNLSGRWSRQPAAGTPHAVY